MARLTTQRDHVSPGQLAKRWGVAVERVNQLVSSGFVHGAFKIPSSGRFGEAVRIPLAAILEVEASWAVTETRCSSQQQKSPDKRPVRELKHFPELSSEPVVGCRVGGQSSDECTAE
jgi:hypothetical protein